jgi:hypothetical protein
MAVGGEACIACADAACTQVRLGSSSIFPPIGTLIISGLCHYPSIPQCPDIINATQLLMATPCGSSPRHASVADRSTGHPCIALITIS